MPRLLDIEVALSNILPRIWRRFYLREDVSFLELHYALQAACDWDFDGVF